MNNQNQIYDVIGVGFGPANIAVAIAFEEMEFKGSVKFLESRKNSIWQENMLFENSDIQNHPLRDLVTPRNPRSKYSFTNFLFENDRLYEHLNTGLHLPFRLEYAQYIAWVVEHFTHLVEYNSRVEMIELIQDKDEMDVYKISDQNGATYYSYSVIVAPGREPNIPEIYQNVHSERIIHLTNFLKTINELPTESLKRIAVVGGSQSAVEIILYLSEMFPESDVIGLTRVFGYKQKDVNPFTGEVYYPSFVNLFHKSDDATKKRLIDDLNLTNYSASDADVLDELYHKMYKQKITNKQKISIHRSAEIKSVKSEAEDVIQLLISKVECEDPLEEKVNLVILATGFKNFGIGINDERFPKILRGLYDHLAIEENDFLRINLDYSVPMTNGKIASCFLNGLCESSHGMGDAGSFSLLALRSGEIVKKVITNLNVLKTNNKRNEKLIYG